MNSHDCSYPLTGRCENRSSEGVSSGSSSYSSAADFDDDDEDDNDGAGDAAASSSSSSRHLSTSEIRTKKKHDKAPESSTKPGEEGKATEELEAVPLRRRLDDTLTMILDAQGIIQHAVSYDKEDGEIIHYVTKEQIAELFRLNPDEVSVDDSSVPASDIPIP